MQCDAQCDCGKMEAHAAASWWYSCWGFSSNSWAELAYAYKPCCVQDEAEALLRKLRKLRDLAADSGMDVPDWAMPKTTRAHHSQRKRKGNKRGALKNTTPPDLMGGKRNLVCATCGRGERDGVKLQMCNGCGAVLYCGRDCQQTHWPQHKQDCRARKVKDAL